MTPEQRIALTIRNRLERFYRIRQTEKTFIRILPKKPGSAYVYFLTDTYADKTKLNKLHNTAAEKQGVETTDKVASCPNYTKFISDHWKRIKSSAAASVLFSLISRILSHF